MMNLQNTPFDYGNIYQGPTPYNLQNTTMGNNDTV